MPKSVNRPEARKREPCSKCGHPHGGNCENCRRCTRVAMSRRDPPATHEEIDEVEANLTGPSSPLGDLLLREARRRADAAYGPREE